MTTDPTLSMLLAGIRTLTAMLGGFAIAKGWITSDQVTQISGSVVVLATAGFALYSQYQNKAHIKTALAMPPPGSSNTGELTMTSVATVQSDEVAS